MTIPKRPLGRTGVDVPLLGYGTVKIGRNQGLKHGAPHTLPTPEEASRLLNGMIDLGISLIDTAPAYGLSERRIGEAIAGRREEVFLSTKVGERFEDGESSFDFSAEAVHRSLERSLEHLRTDRVDLALVHSDGADIEIMTKTACVESLRRAKEKGLVRFIGLSGKTVEGATAALEWADAIMVPLNLEDRSHEAVIAEADHAGVGVLVKKALASGSQAGPTALRYAAGVPGVSAIVVGSLRMDHMLANAEAIMSG